MTMPDFERDDAMQMHQSHSAKANWWKRQKLWFVTFLLVLALPVFALHADQRTDESRLQAFGQICPRLAIMLGQVQLDLIAAKGSGVKDQELVEYYESQMLPLSEIYKNLCKD